MEDFNPASFTVIELIYPLVLALLAAFVISTIGGLIARKWATAGEIFTQYFVPGIPIALIGYAVGYLTGLSRAPATANVLPAVLAAVGGLSAYAFGADAKYKFVVGYCVSLLVISLFYGVQSGSYEREAHREDRLKATFELERRLINYRKNRDLPDKAADWLFLGESVGK